MITTDAANSDKIKYAHLFEIELAVLKVMSDVFNTNIIVVSDIDKCFIGMSISYKYTENSNTKIGVATVTDINRYGNYIVIDKNITINKFDIICETLHIAGNLPYFNSTVEYLEYMHSAFGTLTGKLMFTNYDIPIVTDAVKRDVYNDTGYGVYIPYAIQYKEVSVDKTGKITTGEISLANENQIASQIVLTHNALRGRTITIKKIYFEESLWTDEQNKLYNTYQTCIPINNSIYVGATDENRVPHTELSEFYEYRYIPDYNVKTEFSGVIDNISLSSEVATITALLNLDTEQGTIIPKRKYNRLRCDFVYKGEHCRFKSGLTLQNDINSSETTITIQDLAGVPYFTNIEANEEITIKIENELIVVTNITFTSVPSNLFTFIAGRFFGNVPTTTIAVLTIKTRGYGGTVAAAHNANTAVDIPMCGKTEHDCIMRGNIAYFGGFPAIPKNKNYTTGSAT